MYHFEEILSNSLASMPGDLLAVLWVKKTPKKARDIFRKIPVQYRITTHLSIHNSSFSTANELAQLHCSFEAIAS